jgi:flavorubredoxin
MAAQQTTRKMEKPNYKEQQLRCKQLNLQHSRAATDNLMQMMAKENIGIALTQEPYIIRGKPQRMTSRYRTFIAGGENSRAAIIISDTRINALLITQHSDKDAVLLEIDDGQTQFYAASIYLDYRDPIENIIKTIEEIITLTRGEKLIVAMDSNSRSTTWHDVLTNFRGKVLEVFSLVTNYI